ncbi:hypothetical protein [Okeania sp. SIO3B5]|uniref:hypothetical protein n=1 Tax=Okeania sp. SIO3B5 TaxID=2607811 RepID=UPI0025F0647F|nr:hypothetical protein [Okeania sp. SIO3B5]
MEIIQYLPGTGGRSPFLIGLSQTIFLRCGGKTIAPYYLLQETRKNFGSKVTPRQFRRGAEKRRARLQSP